MEPTNITTHTASNGNVYYSTTDDTGATVYSFTQDFTDTWDQETQEQHTAGPITFLEFWNAGKEIESLWWTSIACPTGKEWIHNTTTEDEEEHCDLNESDTERWHDLTGTVSEDGREWAWDGSGNPLDLFRSTLMNLKVFAIA